MTTFDMCSCVSIGNGHMFLFEYQKRTGKYHQGGRIVFNGVNEAIAEIKWYGYRKCSIYKMC